MDSADLEGSVTSSVNSFFATGALVGGVYRPRPGFYSREGSIRGYRPLALRPVTMVMEVKRRSALYIGMGRNSLKTEPTVKRFINLLYCNCICL